MKRFLASLFIFFFLSATTGFASVLLRPPPVRKVTLKNGLTLLLLERHQAPLIAFQVYFRAGSVDDESGKTGLAHLFEHMIFKGTRTLNTRNYNKEKPLLDALDKTAVRLIQEEDRGSKADPKEIQHLKDRLKKLEKEHEKWMVPDEYEKLYQEHGGEDLNAHTAPDYTSYEVSLPSNKLELWMRVEADRFRHPVLREFYRERSVVMEERRMSYESSPEGKLWEAFVSQAFLAHPYGKPGIGWMSDLNRLTRPDAEEFFLKYYGPNQAVIVLVGDFSTQRAVWMAEKYFGPIPSRPVPRSRVSEEPLQEGERRVEVEFDAGPSLEIGYHEPGLAQPDFLVLKAISSILGQDRTSRFYKELVEKRKIASSVSTDTDWPGVRFPGLFVIDAEPRHPHSAQELEEAITVELEKLKQTPVQDWELEKVRNQFTMQLVSSLIYNEGAAELLGYYEMLLQDWSYPWKLQEQIGQIRPEQIQETARRYFRKSNRTTAVLIPAKKNNP